jgi:hypothetical protein
MPISIQGSYTPGDIPHTVEVTDTVGGSAAYGLGLGRSYSGKYESRTASLNNQSRQTSYIIGGGADVYARKEISIPLIGGKPPAGAVLNRATDYSTPNYQLRLLQQPKIQTISSPNSSARASGASVSGQQSADPWAVLRSAIQMYYAEGGK